MAKKIITVAFFLFLISCFSISSVSRLNAKSIKNVILIIGDGMGPQQLSLLLHYSIYIKRTQNKELNIISFLENSSTGFLLPSHNMAIITDSANSATEIASGESAALEALGLNQNYENLRLITEKAKTNNKTVGIISDVRLTHATPAAFYAHIDHRSFEDKIAEQFLESNIDLALSGGLKYFLPNNIIEEEQNYFPDSSNLNATRKDTKNLIYEAKKKGFNLAYNYEELLKAQKLPLLGLFSSSTMPDAISQKSESNSHIPDLSDMTEAALRLLSKNENGFFLMIEAGQIDWAGHRNDAGQLLHELLRLDETLGVVNSWFKDRQDTIIILTADHETGSFGLSSKASSNPTKLLTENSNIVRDDLKAEVDYLSFSIFDMLYNQKVSLDSLIHEFDEEVTKRKLNTEESLQLLQTKIILYLNLKISIDKLKKFLKTERYLYGAPNKYFEWNNIEDFDAFYPDSGDRRVAALARILSEEQGVVWGSGGHTHSFVPLITKSNSKIQNNFSGLLTSRELGKILNETIEN